MSCFAKSGYHAIANQDQLSDNEYANDDLQLHPKTPPDGLSARKTAVLILLAISVTFATVFSAVSAAVARQSQYNCYSNESIPLAISSTSSVPKHARPYDSCGQSPAEARSRGCKFDIMSFAWLTLECYDDTLEHEFMSWANWTWYLREDAEDDTKLPLEVVALSEQDTFVDWTYHIVHCTFMWRQQHVGLENGWVGRHLVKYHHTVHCQHSLLMDAYENRFMRTPARIMHPICMKVGTDQHMYPGPAN